ncbi:single-stranded-DNA-specific exonuclease RecJ [Candidatus Beckwithbacteria bacterium RIFCSPHIGHO2_12_FULL_47_17]|uniref:Single-stranded-DNA-specific exonuclease RecJ n=1 Tax=Candidatus Beckwithbacteria bacterium RIFCSPHIGHO2_12_FULL_47_17 TaxID=1797460 RepID=A0A1F5DK31_9BACT|nr:MAG: single-stranded-DNA-specific exonuclease RecJ [Candidatus Beckwithbacteria bacterium RIFCSPHIGHO2_12_FULL_47_17]
MTVIDILLKKRGLTSPDKIKEFFSPQNPQKISLTAVGIKPSAIDRAAGVIKSAIKAQRPIYVYGDYDADGISATAVLWEALHQLKAQVLPYIAGRNDPVRGLSVNGLKNFKNKPLVITVDNGITGFEAADFAKKNGLDLIITDHHQPKQEKGKTVWPEAAAIVHSDQLAGVGVAWFLARHLRGERSSHLGGDDLAAIGTIADMVPLLGANRSLVKYGLEKLQTSPRPGIIALAKAAQIDLAKITPHQVSFTLAPRLNAMGRLADSVDALRLLCTTDPKRAQALTVKLNEVNQLRQDQTITMFADARQKVGANRNLVFVQSQNYNEGLVGLVAGRLAEEFHRPAVVVALGPHHAKASMRSIKSFDAIKAIRDLGDLVMERGGHPMAAGFTADAKNLPKIKKQLEAAAARLTDEDLQPETGYDCDLELKQINWELFKELERFAPFGFGNPVPLFYTKSVKLLSFYPVGAENRHLKLKLPGFAGIAFGQGDLAEKLEPGQLIDIIYSIEQNSWNNHQSLELKIKEIKVGK